MQLTWVIHLVNMQFPWAASYTHHISVPLVDCARAELLSLPNAMTLHYNSSCVSDLSHNINFIATL